MLGIAGNLQDAACGAVDRVTLATPVGDGSQCMKVAGAIEARCPVVVERQHRQHHCRQVARRFHGRCGLALEEVNADTPPRQGLGDQCAGESGADDDGVLRVHNFQKKRCSAAGAFWCINARSDETPEQHFPLARNTRPLLACKAGPGQPFANGGGHGPRGQCRPRL